MTCKILFFFDAADWRTYFPLGRAAAAHGYTPVIALAGEFSTPQGEDRDDAALELLSLPTLKKLNIFSLLKLIGTIYKMIARQKPECIHVITLKFSFICALAALPFPKMQKIFTMAGLGYVFRGGDQKSAMLRGILRPFLTLCFRRPNTTLIFENPDDLKLFTDQGYIRAENAALTSGSGVDMTRFAAKQVEPDYPPLVLMPTRLVHAKGISVFIEASKILKAQGIEANFQIAGGAGANNPGAISAEEMNDMVRNTPTSWIGRVADMPSLLARATLIVYPSYYGEGIPRVLLEACAMGKAIVTTDHTGCREAVRHGHNGFLVPIKNPEKTAEAIHDLLIHASKRRIMEQNSLERARLEFDVRHVVSQTLDIYKTVIPDKII